MVLTPITRHLQPFDELFVSMRQVLEKRLDYKGPFWSPPACLSIL